MALQVAHLALALDHARELQDFVLNVRIVFVAHRPPPRLEIRFSLLCGNGRAGHPRGFGMGPRRFCMVMQQPIQQPCNNACNNSCNNWCVRGVVGKHCLALNKNRYLDYVNAEIGLLTTPMANQLLHGLWHGLLHGCCMDRCMAMQQPSWSHAKARWVTCTAVTARQRGTSFPPSGVAVCDKHNADIRK